MNLADIFSQNDNPEPKARPLIEAQALDLQNLYAEYLKIEELKEGDLVVERPGLTTFTSRSGLAERTVLIIWKVLPDEVEQLSLYERTMIESMGESTMNGMLLDCIVGFISDDGLKFVLHSTRALTQYRPDAAAAF